VDEIFIFIVKPSAYTHIQNNVN